MAKEKIKTTDVKSTNDQASKKIENKTTKEDGATTSLPDKASADKESPKSDQSEQSTAQKETYGRGESQKPVTKAYRNNWNAIFKRR